MPARRRSAPETPETPPQTAGASKSAPAAKTARTVAPAKSDRPAKSAKSAKAGKTARTSTPLTEAYIASGDWNPLWDAMRAMDPAFVEAYLAFRSVPHRTGPLPPKFKELILVAINVATTHLYAPGARRHMQNALRHGATAEEILEVIQLTTVMGIHSVNMAVPMLLEELEMARTSSPGAVAPAPAAASGTARRVTARTRSTRGTR